MPLFHLFNQEMINLNSPCLPVDDVEFLCQRYSDEAVMDFEEDETAAVKKDTWYQHLLSLRESNTSQRTKILEAMQTAVMQSIGDEATQESAWNDNVSPAMFNILRSLLEGSYAIMKVHNPSHLSSTIDMLRFIDQALAKL